MSTLTLSPTAQTALSVIDTWHRIREREGRTPHHCVATSMALAHVLLQRGIHAEVHKYILNVRMVNQRGVRVGPVNDTYTEQEKQEQRSRDHLDPDCSPVEYHFAVETEDFFIDPSFDQFSESKRDSALDLLVDPIIIPWSAVALPNEMSKKHRHMMREMLQGDRWDFVYTHEDYMAFYDDQYRVELTKSPLVAQIIGETNAS